MKQIILCDTSYILTTCWEQLFAGVENVKVCHGSAFEHEVDALVSPANSFGFMDGGFDYLLTQVLGEHVQKKLQHEIVKLPERELLVGKSLTIETGHEKWPYLISAPTMRVPMILEPSSVNVYLAAKAVFNELMFNPKISSVCMTGFGTGVGKVSPMTCAVQMKAAYDAIFDDNKFPGSWHDAQAVHRKLCLLPPKDLQEE